MLFRKESYSISTLCNPDSETIVKITNGFMTVVALIFERNPDLKETVFLRSEKPSKTRSWIAVKGKELRLCRLIWYIYGEKDSIEKFFTEWKKADKNPYRCFTVRPEYFIGQLSKLMCYEE